MSNNENWKIFQGSKKPHDDIKNLPSAPPWRSLRRQESAESSLEEIKGKTFEIGENE